MEVNEKLVLDFRDMLLEGLEHTINNDLGKSIREKLLSEVSEIFYDVVKYDISKVTPTLKEKNELIYSQSDIAIYLRMKGEDKPTPFYLEDEFGTNYLMEEGTNSIVLAYRYKELCQILGLDYDTSQPQAVITQFNNTLVPLIEELRTKTLMLDNIIVTDIKNLSHTEATPKPVVGDVVVQIKEDIDDLIQTYFWKSLKSDLKMIKDTVINNQDGLFNFKIEFDNYSVDFVSKDEEQDLQELVISFKSTVKKLSHDGAKTINLGDYTLNYPFENKTKGLYPLGQEITQEEWVELKKYVKDTIQELIHLPENRVQKIPVTLGERQEEITLMFITPAVKKQATIVGSTEDLKLLQQNIMTYLTQGTFIKDPKDKKDFKSFFMVTQTENGMFKILYNHKDEQMKVVLVLGSEGFYVGQLGTKVSDYLAKNNLSLDMLTYSKKEGQGMPLSDLIKIINGVANKVIWDGILGFYDGRTTIKSAVKKTEAKQLESPEIVELRKKYDLPKAVAIVPYMKIIGNFYGIPELEGSNEMFINMFGINKGNPLVLRKEEILSNPKEYVIYGLKLDKLPKGEG